MAIIFLTLLFRDVGQHFQKANSVQRMTIDEMKAEKNRKEEIENAKKMEKELESLEKALEFWFPEANIKTPSKTTEKAKSGTALTVVSEGYDELEFYNIRLKNVSNKTFDGSLTIKVVFTDGTSNVQSFYFNRMERGDIREKTLYRGDKKIKSWGFIQ